MEWEIILSSGFVRWVYIENPVPYTTSTPRATTPKLANNQIIDAAFVFGQSPMLPDVQGEFVDIFYLASYKQALRKMLRWPRWHGNCSTNTMQALGCWRCGFVP